MSVPVGSITSVSPQTVAQAQALSSQVNVLSLVLIALLVVMMVRCSYPQLVLLDLLQYIHLHVYVILAPMPYLFMQVLSTLKNVNFAFLPALYSNPSPSTTSPYYNFQSDTTLLGNIQPLVFFLAIFGGTYLLCWLLSQRFNKFKWLRKKAKHIFYNRMRFSFVHEIFYYTGFYVLFFTLYQFTGANSYINASAANLAVAVMVLLAYVVWLIWITYLGTKYRERLDKIPQKYKFLVYEESQFPMEIPMRGFFKLVVACVLIAGDVSVQLILLMIFNLVYMIYTLCYSPSKSKLTNGLNAFLMVGFIVCEIVFFVYNTSTMSASYQNLISIVLLSIFGIMVLLVVVWIIYRFILYIREEIMGIKPAAEELPKENSKNSKYSKVDYEKLKMPSSNKKSHIKDI
jgi:hypothetical protein